MYKLPPMKKNTSYSDDALKAKLIHEDAERYRRAMITAFAGMTVLVLLAWFLLRSSSLNLTLPATQLRMLTGFAFVICVCSLFLALFSRKLQLAMSIMSIFISILFFPTLMLTGGFISPFIIVYLLSMLLSIILVDLVPVRIGLINFLIITGSYILVSLGQKAGILPVQIEYVEQLMKQDNFFWLIFVSVTLCFIHGFFAVYASSRNVRETLTQMILMYRHVAEGTSAFIGEHFSTEICEALRKTLRVTNAFLIELENDNKFTARVFISGNQGKEQLERTITEEFRNLITKPVPAAHIITIKEIGGFPLKIVPESQFVYWIPVNDTTGSNCTILGVIDPLINKTRGVLVDDILQIFGNRISAEFARSAEEKKRLQIQTLLGQGQKMQAIGKLANVIAHDFNNILNGIFGFASLINKVSGPDSVQAKYTGKIFQLGNNATTLISKLLSYGRSKQANSTLFDIALIVEECLDIIRLTVKKQIDISSDNVKGVNGYGDASMVQSALLNLLINACDSIENKGSLFVKTEKRFIEKSTIQDFLSGQNIPDGDYVIVSVKDTGCGIPEDQLIRIFEPFFTTKGVGRGTGLGLAAVIGCMEAHQGYITVTSALGVGSTFNLYFPLHFFNDRSNTTTDTGTIVLPLDKMENTYITTEQLEKVKDNTGSKILEKEQIQMECDLKGLSDAHKVHLRCKIKKILVVDDDLMILDAISTYLKCLQYQIISCNSGESAIKMFDSNKDLIEVAILDMIIPDIPGRVLMDQFRVINPKLEVIIMTGFSNLADIEHVKKQGVVTILNKPFEFNCLDTLLIDMALKK
jgi:signal transduction histidine kinase